MAIILNGTPVLTESGRWNFGCSTHRGRMKDALYRDTIKSRKQGETQWGAFIEAPEIKNLEKSHQEEHMQLLPENVNWNTNEKHDVDGKSHLTPYLEIRERLQRGMYELVYDKPCVRSSVGSRDGSTPATMKPVSTRATASSRPPVFSLRLRSAVCTPQLAHTSHESATLLLHAAWQAGNPTRVADNGGFLGTRQVWASSPVVPAR